MTSPLPDLTFVDMRVDEIRVSDMVDLEGDRYADPHAGTPDSSWQFEYGAVVDIERETPTCIRLDFHNSESVGFPPDHVLKVHRLAEDDL
jgi:hypothetical protein